MTRRTRQELFARSKHAEASKPVVARSPASEDKSEKRIERLEQRLGDSFLGDDGLAAMEDGIDRSGSGDPLKRAVRRSNIKRGSRKA